MDLRQPITSLLQNGRAQLLHALLIVTYLAVYTVVLSAVALGPTVIGLLTDPAQSATTPNRALAQTAEITLFENRVWPVAALLILVLGAHSLVITHRVFGPIARVGREAQAIAGGDLARRFHFRRNDSMAELEAALNEMLAGLDSRVEIVKSAAARCRARLDALEQNGAGREPAAPRLAAEFARVEAALAGFRTTSDVDPAGATGVAGATHATQGALGAPSSSACSHPNADPGADPQSRNRAA